MSIVRWCLVMGCLIGFLGTARADDPLAKPKDPVAQEHLSQGNKLYRLRDFEKAIEEYKAGALKEDAPVFLYNLGQCYRQLGKYEDAIWHYERFLSRAQPSGDMRTAVEDFVKQMKSELDKKAMSQPPTEPAPDPGKSKPAEPAPHVVAPPPETAISEPWYSDTLGWTLSGAGLVATGIGGYLLFDASDLYDQANHEPRQEVRTQLRSQGDSRRTSGVIVGVGGVALLTAGIIKLAIHPSATRETTETAWNVGVSSNSLFVFGSF